MTQKQIFGVTVGVALLVVVCAFVYQQFTREQAPAGTATMSGTAPAQKNTTPAEEAVVVPVPDTIDGIATSIEAESALDLSALDDEEAGSLQEVDQDSDSVNNLGTSYDENNL